MKSDGVNPKATMPLGLFYSPVTKAEHGAIPSSIPFEFRAVRRAFAKATILQPSFYPEERLI